MTGGDSPWAYPTATKRGCEAVAAAYVKWATAYVSVPIGGIIPENVAAVREGGARRICVVGAILRARYMARARHEFQD